MKCVIIEDEKPAQRLLKSYISKHKKLELLAVFDSALETDLSVLDNCDLLFLDIHLPQISGLDYIKALSIKPEIVITTAFPNYALDAFELEIVDYLLKPFSFERFLKAVLKTEKIIQLKLQNPSKAQKDFFFIYTNKAFYRIKKEDILFIKSTGDYINIHTSKDTWMINDTLKNWQSKLPEHTFLKVHQSYIVNKDKIDKFQGNCLYIQKNEIPVSRIHRMKLVTIFRDK